MALIPAHEARFTVIDLETTSLKYREGRAIEFAAAVVENGQITKTWSTLINPGAGIDPGATHIHRITREMLDSAPLLEDVIGDIVSLMRGSVIVAHNARFDLPYLRSEFGHVNLAWPENLPQMCTLEGSRYLLPEMPNHKLGTLCEQLGIALEGAHAAEADVVAAAKLHLHLLGMAPGILVNDPSDIAWPDVVALNAGIARAA